MILTNTKIKKLKKSVKKGSDYGGWVLHIVWLDDPDWKDEELSFFEKKDTKVVPEEGETYAIIEIEEGKKGYVIKGLTKGAEKPKPDKSKGAAAQKEQRTEENPKTMHYSYAKDVAVALVNAGKKKDEMEPWIRLIARSGDFLHTCAEKGAPKLPEDAPKPSPEEGKGDDKGAEPEPEPEPETDTDLVSTKDLWPKVADMVIEATEKTAKSVIPRKFSKERYKAVEAYLDDLEKPVEVGEFLADLADIMHKIK